MSLTPVPRTRPVALVAALLVLLTLVGLAVVRPSAEARPGPGVRLPAITAEATITGTVVDDRGRPAEDVLAEALDPGDPTGEPVASSLTYAVPGVARHGAYRLHVPAGDYLVRFSSPRDDVVAYATTYFGGGSGTSVRAVEGQDLRLAATTLTRERGVPVSGTVVDQAGVPLARSEVTLVRVLRDGSTAPLATRSTDAAGGYTFSSVYRDRTYTVRSSGDAPRALPATFLGGTPSALGAETFHLPSTSAGWSLPALVVAPGVRVSGRVTSPQDSTPHATVSLLEADTSGRTAVSATRTVWDGGQTYEFVAIPGHRYTVGVVPESTWSFGGSYYLGGDVDPTSAATFEVAAGAPVAVPPIVVGARTSVVKVRLQDERGRVPSRTRAVPTTSSTEGLFVGHPEDRSGGRLEFRVPWGRPFTIEVYDDAAEESVYLGDTIVRADAVVLTASAGTPVLDAGTVTIGHPAPTAPPVAVLGAARVGEPLSARSPDWSAPRVRTTYRWQRGGKPIRGADRRTYVVRPADIGRAITVVATGARGGHLTGQTTSAAVVPTTGLAPRALLRPTIVGAPEIGTKLSVRSSGRWSVEYPRLAFQWLRNGRPIAGATARSYRVRATDAGAAIGLLVRATLEGHAPGAAASTPVRIRRLPSELTATAVPRRPAVTIWLTVDGQAGPSGEVRVRLGRKVVGTTVLRPADRGVARIALRLRPGKHRVVAEYVGTPAVAGSSSGPIRVTVR